MTTRRLRGRTRSGRLSRLDAILLHTEAELLARRDGPFESAVFVDLGIGELPLTTLESARALRRVNPQLRCIGVEIDPQRLAHARSRTDAIEAVEFRAGGFALPLAASEPARLVRAMNVLRSYPQDAVAAAHAALCEPLLPDGLLVEGTCSPEGAVLCAHFVRRQQKGARRQALCLSSDFSRGFAPLQFRDWLPRDLRRCVRPDTAVGGFLYAWQRTFEQARGGGRRSARALFEASVEQLARTRSDVVHDRALWAQGCVLWQPPQRAEAEA